MNHKLDEWIEEEIKRQKNNQSCRKSYWKNPQKQRERVKKYRIENPWIRRRYQKENDCKSVWFRGKSVHLEYNPRTGVCSKCHRKVGEGIKKTYMHHTKYHDNDPLKYTIELCGRCHWEEHWKRKK